jgi:hypothetical protein
MYNGKILRSVNSLINSLEINGGVKIFILSDLCGWILGINEVAF